MNIKKRKKTKVYILLGLLAILFFSLAIGFNNNLKTTYYTITNDKIPQSFDNYRIVQISDFHNKTFGNNEELLIRAINDCHPDIIVLTGDMIDDTNVDLHNVEMLLKGITSIAPVYSVDGNHEFDFLDLYSVLCSLYEKYGVTQIDNKTFSIYKGSDSITLSGIETLVFGNHSSKPNNVSRSLDTSTYNILLHHYSNHFDVTSSLGYDLILAGHTHGGIIRLPLIGGVLGNNGDLFPAYDGGIYHENNCTMVSSKGLGDAQIPRFNNPPELVCIILKAN